MVANLTVTVFDDVCQRRQDSRLNWLGFDRDRLMATALYPLASLAQIEKTPSVEDGLPHDLEEDLRAYGCKLIHQAGILLKQYRILLLLTVYHLRDTEPGNRWQSLLHRFYSIGSGLSLP
jgi:hypothetical protein